MIDNVLFDWDGTIVDSSEGILECLRYSLQSVSFPPQSEEMLRSFIGPSLVWSYNTVLGMDKETTKTAIASYVYAYAEKGGYKKFKLFDGIKELIIDLYNRGIKVSIVSAKPIPQLKKVVEHSGLAPYLDKLVGPNGEGKQDSDKSEFIKIAKNGNSTIMVGDTDYDITSARKAGIPSIAVLYGFGFKQKENTGADYVVSSVQELRNILLK